MLTQNLFDLLIDLQGTADAACAFALHIHLHRINDNKVEVLARGGGYAVPL